MKNSFRIFLLLLINLLSGPTVYAATGNYPVIGYGTTPAISNMSVNGFLNVQPYGALGNCNDPVNGTGCTDDSTSIINTAKAACNLAVSGSTNCTATVYLPPGNFYVSSLQLNAGNLTIAGGTNALIGLRIVGAGSGNTTILCQGGVGSFCMDLFGDAGVQLENLTIKTLTSATGVKSLLGFGKISSCNCDVVTMKNVSLQTYSTANVGVLYDIGTENMNVHDSTFYAWNGGHGIVLSTSNAFGLTPTGVTLNSGQALQPVSMTSSNFTGNVIYVNGGTSPTAAPAAAVYFDADTGGHIGNDSFYDNDIQLNGYNDVAFWDGAVASTSNIINAINGRNNFVECFSGVCGAGSQEQAIKLGATTKGIHFDTLTFTKVASADQRTTVTTSGSTAITVTSAGFACPNRVIGWAADIQDVNGNGTIPGTYVVGCAGTTVTVNTATLGAGAQGLTMDLIPPDIQLYNTHTNFVVSGAGPGVYECPIGFGSSVQWNGYFGAAQANCPGAASWLNGNGVLSLKEPGNGVNTQTLVLRRYSDNSANGHMFDISNAAGTLNFFTLDASGNIAGNAALFNSSVTSNTTITGLTSVSGGFLQMTPKAFASCPAITNASTGACNIAGLLCAITDDSTACGFSATIVNGGTHKVLGYCDGTQYVMTECK